MKRMFVVLAASLLACSLAAALLPGSVSAQAAAAPCVRTKFDTKLTQDACAKGGQEAAKAAWKTWMSEAKKTDATLSCKSCHAKMGPDFPTNADGLTLFKKLGGK